MPIEDRINGAEQANGDEPNYELLARKSFDEAGPSLMFVTAKSVASSRPMSPHLTRRDYHELCLQHQILKMCEE